MSATGRRTQLKYRLQSESSTHRRSLFASTSWAVKCVAPSLWSIGWYVTSNRPGSGSQDAAAAREAEAERTGVRANAKATASTRRDGGILRREIERTITSK